MPKFDKLTLIGSLKPPAGSEVPDIALVVLRWRPQKEITQNFTY